MLHLSWAGSTCYLPPFFELPPLFVCACVRHTQRATLAAIGRLSALLAIGTPGMLRSSHSVHGSLPAACRGGRGYRLHGHAAPASSCLLQGHERCPCPPSTSYSGKLPCCNASYSGSSPKDGRLSHTAAAAKLSRGATAGRCRVSSSSVEAAAAEHLNLESVVERLRQRHGIERHGEYGEVSVRSAAVRADEACPAVVVLRMPHAFCCGERQWPLAYY